MKKLTIVLDCDETLMGLFDVILPIAEKHFETDLKKDMIRDWEMKSISTPIRKFLHKLMQETYIVKRQVPMEGSQEFVQALRDRGHKVLFFSAVDPKNMPLRAKQLIDHFGADKSDIVLGGNKKLMCCDILIDDHIGNLTGSMAKEKVLFDQPWNRSNDEMTRVCNYAETLSFVDKVAKQEEHEDGKFLVVVGPSASGKSTIMQELICDPRFVIPKSVTTRAPRNDKSDEEYLFVTDDMFKRFEEENALLEHSEYAGNKYGLSRQEVECIRDMGQIPIKAMDINGARSVKKIFGDNAVTVFIKRDKAEIINTLKKRMTSEAAEIARRIEILDSEFENEKECDMVISNNSTIEDATTQILSIFD